jgi:membrane associated rhomboid family serine protease
MAQSPRWLDRLERIFGWIAIPNIAIIFVTLQGLGFLMLSADPIWLSRLALVPEMVSAGEYWRLITFLALPVSMSLIWVIFTLWFLYFILNMIETEWGAFKTTLYVLVSILVTIAFSFAFDFPITNVSDFQSTLFLAAASLFPEYEIRLYFAIPVKMKWMAWLSIAFLVFKFFNSGSVGKLYLLAIYSNYLVFFGPAMLGQVKQWIRRENFKRKMGR